MSALLTKEFLSIRRQGKPLLLGLAIAFFGVLPSFVERKDNEAATALNWIIALAALLAVVLTVNAMAYEEKANWDVFVRSLPINSRTIVGARYVLALIFSTTGTALTFAVALLLCHGHIETDIQTAVWLGAGAAPLIVCSVLLPLFYKFGLQKTRLVFFTLIFIVPLLLATVFIKAGVTLSWVSLLPVVRASPLIVFAVVVASFFLSCRIYSWKEL